MRVVSWIFVGGLFASCLPAQGQVWSQQFPVVSPPARFEHSMAFDSMRGRTVLFGGASGPWVTILGDTWEWDGSDWQQRTPASTPSPRAAPMAYDSQRHRVVLFGGWQGDNYPLLADTWEWDGTQWIPRFSAHFPSARGGAAMAFDSQRGRTLLFGGMLTGGTLAAETWEWDGIDWVQRFVPSPPARWAPAMAYDSNRGRSVLFGGLGTSTDLNDTWEWDGTTWIPHAPMASPGPRERHTMAFDSLRNRTVLFGGRFQAVIYNELWEWDGTTWVHRYSPAPAPRMDSAAAFHAARGRMVVFGGNGSFGATGLADTWEWGGPSVAAAARSFGTGCGLSIAPATNSRPVLGTSQLTDVTGVPSGGPFMAVGLSDTAVGPFALPLRLDGFGLSGCWLYHDCIDFAEPCMPIGPGTTRHTISVPNNAGLLGLQVYLQAWGLAPAANPAGQINSNAIELTVGNL
jgi:hypothetical protein